MKTKKLKPKVKKLIKKLEKKPKSSNKHPRLDKKTGLYKYPKDLSGLSGDLSGLLDVASYFPKVKIIVDSEQSKDQILKVIEYIHYLECINSDFMAVNSFMHLYLFPGSVEVKPDYDFDYGPHRDTVEIKKSVQFKPKKK